MRWEFTYKLLFIAQYALNFIQQQKQNLQIALNFCF